MLAGNACVAVPVDGYLGPPRASMAPLILQGLDGATKAR
jgi:hypothetical protein